MCQLNDTWFFEVRRGNVTTLRELLHRGADVEWCVCVYVYVYVCVHVYVYVNVHVYVCV